MTVTEHVAYVKGLFEGLNLDCETKESKLFASMLNLLEDLATEVSDLKRSNEDLMEELDAVNEELSALIEDCYDEAQEQVNDELFDMDNDDELYQVICPTCSEHIFLDDEALEEGGTHCPACGEELEFDLSELEEENAISQSEENV